MRLYSFVFAAALAVFVESRWIDECDLSLAYQPSKTCGANVMWMGLNSSQIGEILDALALYGQDLTWSTDLTDWAQAYVNQCGNDSGPCSTYPGPRIYTWKRTDSNSSESPADMIREIYDNQDMKIPDIEGPDMKIPDIEGPDMEITDKDFAEIDMPEIDLTDDDLPANDTPDTDAFDSFFYRRRRSLDRNDPGTVGCGFIMYRMHGTICKYISCFYGNEHGQGYE